LINWNIILSWEKEIVKKRVLIVDDHKMFRDGLKALINRQADMEVIGKAENGQQAIEVARELQPDVILMDVKMPVMDGIEATRQILSEMPGIKILALSMYTDNGFIRGMLHIGAQGYIAKDSDPEELYKAIRRIASSGNT
jgi:DNA-binding NarL/FixJ family response regulator